MALRTHVLFGVEYRNRMARSHSLAADLTAPKDLANRLAIVLRSGLGALQNWFERGTGARTKANSSRNSSSNPTLWRDLSTSMRRQQLTHREADTLA